MICKNHQPQQISLSIINLNSLLYDTPIIIAPFQSLEQYLSILVPYLHKYKSIHENMMFFYTYYRLFPCLRVFFIGPHLHGWGKL